VTLTRRELLLAVGGTAVSCAPLPGRTTSKRRTGIRGVSVDAFVVFDPRPFARALESAFPGRGAAIAASYRVRLFEYGWLRALGKRYQDFWRVSCDALDATAEAEGVALPPATRASLLKIWASLPPWPDAVEGVRALSGRGLQLAILSNWSPRMIDEGLERTGLRDVVRSLSTDAARTYKPDPAAYALAPETFRLSRDEVLFVAFAAWDAAGASWFGFPTVWMNRVSAPPDHLGMERVMMARSFADLAV
jgi:2-haloacid dehalogenase